MLARFHDSFGQPEKWIASAAVFLLAISGGVSMEATATFVTVDEENSH